MTINPVQTPALKIPPTTSQELTVTARTKSVIRRDKFFCITFGTVDAKRIPRELPARSGDNNYGNQSFDCRLRAHEKEQCLQGGGMSIKFLLT
jgi:hypothetical protein